MGNGEGKLGMERGATERVLWGREETEGNGEGWGKWGGGTAGDRGALRGRGWSGRLRGLGAPEVKGELRDG